jgi:hypothetical protein
MENARTCTFFSWSALLISLSILEYFAEVSKQMRCINLVFYILCALHVILRPVIRDKEHLIFYLPILLKQ